MSLCLCVMTAENANAFGKLVFGAMLLGGRKMVGLFRKDCVKLEKTFE